MFGFKEGLFLIKQCFVKNSDTEIDSPYNTYQNIGLPPGPICNPGLDSIKAAVYPVKTDYNFFLSKPGTGETVFSRTIEEHNANKVKYLQ